MAADAVIDPNAVMVKLLNASIFTDQYLPHTLQWREV